MVDNALLEQVLRLDPDSRRELVRVVQGSLDDEVLPEGMLAEVRRRLEEMGPEPLSDYITLDEFVREIGARPSRHAA